MILSGQLLLSDLPGRCRVEAGTIQVHNGIITTVNLGEFDPQAEIAGRGLLISPGFIDAHLHLPQFDTIGAHGLPLLQWLSEVTFPAEAKWADCDYATAMTSRAIDQLLSVGTTAIAAYATVHHASAQAALQMASRKGIRGVIGQVLMDRQALPELCVEDNRLLDEAATLQTLYPAGARISAAVTPRFAIACSGELLEGAGALAQQTGAIVQTHLAETRDECENVGQLFDGRSYVEVYRQAGLLSPRSILGHGVHLDAADRATLRHSSATIAHCPTANSFLRSGTMSRHALLRDDVKLAVGSDIGAGYERSMVRVARAMIEAAATTSDTFPDAAQAWHAITAGNADLLGFPGAGRLAVGAAADLVVIEPTIRWLDPPVDPLSRLMFAWDDRWITRTLLAARRH